MKTRFNTYDIICMVTELQRLVGMRVNQVYDIDNRTYVIRLQRSEEKAVLLLESGNRFHTTQFEWPKNVAPSGFTMKLRKHLKNKRLEKLTQLGIDRIVDLQFGSGEAAYHVILELYDRGNIVLADHEWTILNVLRPHVEGDKIRFAVKEKYPLDRAKTSHEPPDSEALKAIFAKSRPGDNLKKILNPNLEYGSSVIDHVLLENGLSGSMKVSPDPGKGFHVERDLDRLESALQQAETMMEAARRQIAKGYITQKREERPNPSGAEPAYFLTNQEFHPLLYHQHKGQPYAEYETFDRAVDEFFSALEGQKIDMKTIQVEREAMKKLQNVRKDHEKRVSELESAQSADKRKAELIARNQELVEQARLAVQGAIANQMSWSDIEDLLKAAQDNNDPIASCIKQLKLKTNHITLLLHDPFEDGSDQDSNDEQGSEDRNDRDRLEPMLIDIDLSLTAFANARRYYDQKRSAAKKQQKTLESADKALKSAERKTKQTLKEAHTISNISKARKTYWFEKFFWFISSDNYLVIGGRDQQQNELLVKRYMRSADLYVHAEVSGAASVIVKNPSGAPVPPKTLAEAGQAAVAYSVAWEAKVLTRVWWVHAHQVSKSAPTGEYLTTGSFMIRGKKNYLLPDQLQFGFSFLFRLEDSCIERHRDERKAVSTDMSDVTSVTSAQEPEPDEEIPVSDGDDDESDKEVSKSDKLDTIVEETKSIQIENQDNFKEHKSTEITDIQTENTQKDLEDRDSNEEVIEKEQEDTEKGDEEREGASDSDSEDDSSEVFPDTHIKVDHGTGQVFIESKTRTVSEVSDMSDDKPLSFPQLPKKGNKKPQKKESKDKAQMKKEREEKQKEGPKRGQKGKLKKIKEKYKDQDDEDRELRMQLLQSANALKETKKTQKKALAKSGKSKSGPRAVKIPQPAPLILEVDSDVEPEPDQEPEVEPQGPDADTEILSQLTGSPLPEDELLFCVPVVAPYSAVLNYNAMKSMYALDDLRITYPCYFGPRMTGGKSVTVSRLPDSEASLICKTKYRYKVKLTPGTSKRGKAAKTAIQVFLRDKNCTPREKDLLKAVKEENVARNFPGKVKLSAPQLHKHKK